MRNVSMKRISIEVDEDISILQNIQERLQQTPERSLSIEGREVGILLAGHRF
jgi:hypothetical protein